MKFCTVKLTIRLLLLVVPF